MRLPSFPRRAWEREIGCHSEEANIAVYQLVRKIWPTKNLWFPQARFVFYDIPIRSGYHRRLGAKDSSVAGVSINVVKKHLTIRHVAVSRSLRMTGKERLPKLTLSEKS